MALDAAKGLYLKLCLQINVPVPGLVLFTGSLREISNRWQGEERQIGGLLRILKKNLVESAALPLIVKYVGQALLTLSIYISVRCCVRDRRCEWLSTALIDEGKNFL